MRCLSTGFEVALRWLWGGFVLRSVCLVYAYFMALGWLWVASPCLKRSRSRPTAPQEEIFANLGPDPRLILGNPIKRGVGCSFMWPMFYRICIAHCHVCALAFAAQDALRPG